MISMLSIKIIHYVCFHIYDYRYQLFAVIMTVNSDIVLWNNMMKLFSNSLSTTYNTKKHG